VAHPKIYAALLKTKLIFAISLPTLSGTIIVMAFAT
jgi:hypothetical protein